MKIETKEAAYVAHLARLEFQDDEIGRFTAQMNDILLYMEKLNEVDTTGIAPLTSAVAITNAFREDVVHNSLNYDLAVANAPEVRENCFIVPKVVE